MSELLEIAAQYGMTGMVLLAAGWYIIRREVEQKGERQNLTDALQRLHKEALEQSANNAEAIDRNTSVLSSLQTIISRNR